MLKQRLNTARNLAECGLVTVYFLVAVYLKSGAPDLQVAADIDNFTGCTI